MRKKPSVRSALNACALPRHKLSLVLQPNYEQCIVATFDIGDMCISISEVVSDSLPRYEFMTTVIVHRCAFIIQGVFLKRDPKQILITQDFLNGFQRTRSH